MFLYVLYKSTRSVTRILSVKNSEVQGFVPETFVYKQKYE